MRPTSILPHQTQPRRLHRERKVSEEGDHLLQPAPTLDEKTKRSGLAADPLGNKTRLLSGCIRFGDEHPDVTEPGNLRGARHSLGQRQTLVASDAELTQLHPRTPPRNGLGRDRGLVTAAKVREGRQRRVGAPQLSPALRVRTRNADTRPGEQHDGHRGRGNERVHGTERRDPGLPLTRQGPGHQVPFRAGSPKANWKWTKAPPVVSA